MWLSFPFQIVFNNNNNNKSRRSFGRRPYYETNSTKARAVDDKTFDYWTVDDGLVNQWEFIVKPKTKI